MSLLAGAGLGRFNGTVNLVLEVRGNPHGLIMAAGSVDQKNNYVFEITPRGLFESAAQGLSYWSAGSGDDTMITLWNPADEAQDLEFKLFFSGGHYRLPIHLEPRATHMFNVSEITQSQVPDKDGNIIPAAIQEGSAEISGTQGENEVILIAMDAGTYNVRKATCYQHCHTCYGSVDDSLQTIPFAVAVSGTNQLAAISTWNNGTKYDITTHSNWSSNYTNLATVGANTGLVNGVGAGAVQITANAPYEKQYVNNECLGYPWGCPGPFIGMQGVGPGGVGPYQVEPINISSQGPVTAGNCPTNGYPGYVKYVTNQVQYGSGAAFAFAGLVVSDVINVGSRHDLGSGTSTGSATTTGDGSFQDQYSVVPPFVPAAAEKRMRRRHGCSTELVSRTSTRDLQVQLDNYRRTVKNA